MNESLIEQLEKFIDDLYDLRCDLTEKIKMMEHKYWKLVDEIKKQDETQK